MLYVYRITAIIAKFYDSKGHDVIFIIVHNYKYYNLPTELDCVLDICGECRPRYYYNNAEVTEFCST